MKRLNHKLKQGLVLLLTIAIVVGIIPSLPGGVNKVQAATGYTPSVTAFATKDELMTAFVPDSDGNTTTIGKLVFGKNGTQWYILGKDIGVEGDNTIIFATSPISTENVFSSSTGNKTYSYEAGTGYGDNADSIEVYSNHYGASDLRNVLQTMAGDTNYFTVSEQGMMNATTVTNKDTLNDVTYTTTDKLYALQGDYNIVKTLWAGSGDSTVLAMSNYWNSSEECSFWLRSPDAGISEGSLYADPGDGVNYDYVNVGFAVQPASNLDLSKVLFASCALSASSGVVSADMISSDAAMTLRLNGTDTPIGTAYYDSVNGVIVADRAANATGKVSLIIQGNDGTNDWYYSKAVDRKTQVTVADIRNKLGFTGDFSLLDCIIWVETTEDNLTYAKMAEEKTIVLPSVTTFATKDELMTAFSPDSEGNADNIGKLFFGKNKSGDSQQWYIIGKDIGVEGDNTIIFAASPIATGQVFEDDCLNTKIYDTTWECTYSGDITMDGSKYVNPNHYGASDLRTALNDMVKVGNTTYFTNTEQSLMNITTVTTKDMLNNVNYTTKDKLYALQGKHDDSQKLWAGNGNSTLLDICSYWNNGESFWLRSPYDSDCALFADPGFVVDSINVSSENAIQPASNLNLTSVLFASAAPAASSDAVISGTILSDTAMTLRFDGTDKAIGTVIYNASGVIVAQKDAGAIGTVSLVIQGNDGSNYWYYSVPVGGTTVVTAEQIKDKLELNEASDLADCNIWLETTLDNVSYARMAETVETFTVVNVNEVTISGMDAPVGGKKLDTEAFCSSTGIADTTPVIIYTTEGDNGDVEVTGNADWNTTYKASITLTTCIVDSVVYVFGNSVSLTVDGEKMTDGITLKTDGTLTVTKEYTTAKRAIGSVTAPTVPDKNTFTTYYGYEGYDDIFSDGRNKELGEAATVTFEGIVTPTTEDVAVTWSIANDGNADYDRTPGATNTFRWTISASALTNYDAFVCQGYDPATGSITGTVTVKNKAATPVTITGTDSSIAYSGETIDVSQYFTIDPNAGTATYTLITGTDGGTGEGSINGSILTITKTGTFKIKVSTAANGFYAAGETTITLTISNGTIEYNAKDYSGTYDGKAHGISLTMSDPEDADITYSTDGVNYGNDNPSFTNEGTYTVYYRITKDNYDTVNGFKKVTINKKPVTITADDQNIIWGNTIDMSDYTVSEDGLAEGDSITGITLTPSTSSLTEDGTISIKDVKIENSTGVDVTDNYDIETIEGTLKITHDTTLAPDKIETTKTKTTYTAGEILNVDDITVTAYYADGYSGEVTDYETNVSDIDMSKMGDKTLTISYTKNGETKTKNITITVSHNTAFAPDKIEAAKTKTTYTAGETLNVDDITVTAYYADGYSEEVTEYETNVSDIDMSKVGDKTLTVSYTKNDGTKTKDITITVSHNTSFVPERIEAVKTKTTYTIGESLNVDDITVTAYYADGYSEEVTDYETNVAAIDMSKMGDKTLTVSINVKGVELTTSIIIVINAAAPCWKKNSTGWWYDNGDGTYPQDTWKKIDGSWYYFDASGYIVTGWLADGGSWYYLEPNGKMTTGWRAIGGKWYYLEANGKMAANKWVDSIYYVKSNGVMATDEWVDGGRYYVDANGKWVPNKTKAGWKKNAVGWWYDNGDSTYPKSEWKSIDGSWYYFNASGYIVTGWFADGGSWYYFDSNGKMATGWRAIGGKWYYLEANGKMAANKWVNSVYYVKADGAMAIDEWVDGNRYYVDADGKWVPGKTA